MRHVSQFCREVCSSHAGFRFVQKQEADVLGCLHASSAASGQTFSLLVFMSVSARFVQDAQPYVSAHVASRHVGTHTSSFTFC